MKDLRAVILAGGHGTRLRPFSGALPKPLVPAINRPAIAYSMDLIRFAGIREVGVIYSDELLCHVVERLWGQRFNFHWFRDGKQDGTGSALRVLPKTWLQGDVVILPADIANDVDLREMHRAHTSEHAEVTLACAPVTSSEWVGDVLHLSEHSWMRKYEYQPPPRDGVVLGSNGIHLCSPGRFWDLLQGEAPLNLSSDVFPSLLSNNVQVLGFRSKLPPQDFGYPEEILFGARMLFEGVLPGPSRLAPGGDGLWIHPSAQIASSATLVPPVLVGAGASVGEGATIIGPTCIGQGAIVSRRVFVERALVMPGHTIAASGYVGDGLVGDPEGMREVVLTLARSDPRSLLDWPRPGADATEVDDDAGQGWYS